MFFPSPTLFILWFLRYETLFLQNPTFSKNHQKIALFGSTFDPKSTQNRLWGEFGKPTHFWMVFLSILLCVAHAADSVLFLEPAFLFRAWSWQCFSRTGFLAARRAGTPPSRRRWGASRPTGFSRRPEGPALPPSRRRLAISRGSKPKTCYIVALARPDKA